MPSATGGFKDAWAIIYDSKNNYLTRTVITEHDKKTMNIEIEDSLDNVKVGARVNLLVIHSGGASEFSGTVWKPSPGACEISLFGGRERKGRTSARHVLNIPASIKDLTVNGGQESFREPLQVTIENLSSSGVLIRSPLGGFESGYVLKIEFSINGSDAIIFGKVLREQKNPDFTFCYGCQLIFLE